MRLASVLLFTALAATGPEMTRLQEQEKASLWVKRSTDNAHTIKLSETITIVMIVEGDSPLEAFLAEKAKSTDGWHLEAAGKPKVTTFEGGKRQRWEMSFVAKPLQPGSHPLQMPLLQYTEKDGVEHEIKWQPVPMNITTRVAKADISEARDRTNIEELPPAPIVARPWWPWLLAIVPVVAIVAFVAWQKWHRPPVEASAKELAIRQLEALSRLPMENAAQVRANYLQLSQALRQFLEMQLGLPATQRTTAEFFAASSTATLLDQTSKKALEDLMQRCDLAKFAGVAPNSEECNEVILTAKKWVTDFAKR
ncbi:MAG TPA: hypothetical protein VE988_00640 [Gemmataceae bacterium]|nr:hypothetical protein [Gemmataceae bacterium]